MNLYSKMLTRSDPGVVLTAFSILFLGIACVEFRRHRHFRKTVRKAQGKVLHFRERQDGEFEITVQAEGECHQVRTFSRKALQYTEQENITILVEAAQSQPDTFRIAALMPLGLPALAEERWHGYGWCIFWLILTVLTGIPGLLLTWMNLKER